MSRRLRPRAEALSRRLHVRPADRARRARGSVPAASPAPAPAHAAPSRPDPTRPHLKAQDRVVKAGSKLSDQEKFKRELHPFDGYERLKEQAASNEPPKPDDNFRWRFFGLFYCAPTRSPTCAGCASRTASSSTGSSPGWPISPSAMRGGYAHVTTRANLQMREIEPKNAVAMVEAIQDLGLCSRGSGADNIRNVTGTPTAGIDPQELIDTRPYAREWHFHILNDRSLYGLPRKFNVGFDGGGIIPVLEDTNDIGFQAVEVRDGFGLEPGVWFRLALGGITGHKDFARDTGVVVKPADATAVADAIVRVFIDHGDRTDRTKARLKYVLDTMGHREIFRAGRGEARREAYARVSARSDCASSALRPRRPCRRACAEAAGLELDRRGAAGRQADATQMRGARRHLRRSRRRRYPPDRLAEPAHLRRRRRRSRAGASRDRGARPFHRGNVDPRGSRRLHRQCRLQVRRSDTKRHAEEIAQWCEARVALDQPVNIHLTGCPNSCAQHYIGDIGLLGAQVQVIRGRRHGRWLSRPCRRRLRRRTPAIGREIYRDVKAEDAPHAVERMLKAYLAHRADAKKRSSHSRAGTRSMRLKTLFERSRMSQPSRTPIAFLPESAPFTPEQRDLAQWVFRWPSRAYSRVTALSPEANRGAALGLTPAAKDREDGDDAGSVARSGDADFPSA